MLTYHKDIDVTMAQNHKIITKYERRHLTLIIKEGVETTTLTESHQEEWWCDNSNNTHYFSSFKQTNVTWNPHVTVISGDKNGALAQKYRESGRDWMNEAINRLHFARRIAEVEHKIGHVLLKKLTFYINNK